jgi:ATP-dependent DNA helicase RecG
MELAVETMKNSISENRTDKYSPLVGAVLVMPNGTIEKAFRGELSNGDHAEFTLLERKLVSADLTGTTLFSTLEPCAPGARKSPKGSCAKRIVNRRIAEVWIGIEDPDPLVNGKGIQYLQENGVSVKIFDRDLQEVIRDANADFIKGAEERAIKAKNRVSPATASEMETPIPSAALDDFDTEEITTFIESVKEFKFMYKSDEFHHAFLQLGFLAKSESNVHPTALGLLLFGKNPQVFLPHSVIRATITNSTGKEDIATFSGSLPKQAIDSLAWFKNTIGKHIDRSNAERMTVCDYPDTVVRECIVNALAHRSYDIMGASIHLEINDESIIIRSPGEPASPLSIESIQNFSAPYLSKNPKITYAFEKLGLSENRGLGFRTIRALPEEYGLPLPTVSFDNPYLIFSFSRSYGIGVNDKRLAELSKAEAKGFDYIRLNTFITRKSYEENVGVSTKTAERHLTHFVKLGLVKRIGAGAKTSYEIVG